MMQNEIELIWNQLLSRDEASDSASRIYRLLGESAVGVRASAIPTDQTLELLIEVPGNWDPERKLPDWTGMKLEFLHLSLPPRKNNPHLVLTLSDEDQRNIFLAFCQDLVNNLEGVKVTNERVAKIEASIARWERFFKRCGTDGLSIRKQAGLFGELAWLELMLDTGINGTRCIESWKGCERNFHDFDMEGRVVEVKTSMRKEPQQVIINNERQLDDQGLASLHLFFTALRTADGGGQTLPDKISQIRTLLQLEPANLLQFNDSLINAGYTDSHAPIYRKHFIVHEQLLFRVTDQFPRIIHPPNGIGSLRYGVLTSSCRAFDTDIKTYLNSLMGLPT